MRGQKNVDQILRNNVTREHEEYAIRRAAERVDQGATLPSYSTIPEAVRAAELRSHSKGSDVPLTAPSSGQTWEPGQGYVPLAQQVASMPGAGAPAPPQPAAPGPGVAARQPLSTVAYRSPESGASSAPYSGAGAPQLGRLPAGGPLHLQPTSEDTKITGKTGPYSGLAAESAIGALGARGELAEAQGEAAGAQGTAERQRSDLAAQYEAGLAERHANRLRDANTHLTDYHTKIDRVLREADNMKVDQSKYFSDMSPAQGIIGALLSAVAGFGYGYSGRGINPAEYLNQRIRDSIDAQKEAITNKRASIGEMRNHLAEMRQQFGDNDQAELATELAQRQYVMAHLQNSANDQSIPALQRLNAAKIKSDLAGDQAKTLEQLDDRTMSQFERTQASKYAATGAGAGAGVGVTIDIGGKKQTVPLALYKQLQDAGLAPAAPKEALETRKTEAEIKKTEAETAKLGGAPDDARRAAELEAAARGSAAGVFHDPVSLLSQHFSDTEGSKKKLTREATNAQTIALARKAGAISARGGSEQIKNLLIDDTDSPGEIQEKLRLRDLVFGGPSGGAAPSPNAVEE